jgi:hypothetical protein
VIDFYLTNLPIFQIIEHVMIPRLVNNLTRKDVKCNCDGCLTIIIVSELGELRKLRTMSGTEAKRNVIKLSFSLVMFSERYGRIVDSQVK